MAKKVPLLLLLLCVLSLTGCLPNMTLNDRALLGCIGIDKKEDGYLVTMELVFPSSGDEKGVTAENAVVLSAQGLTVTDAIQQAALQLGKQLFIGQTRVLILGNELVEEGVSELLLDLSKNPELRQNIQLCVSTGEAAQIILAEMPKQFLPSEALESLLESAGQNSLSHSVALFEYLRAAESPYQAAVLPIIEAAEEESQKENALGKLRLNGLALLQNGRMIDTLSASECRAYRLLSNQFSQTVINVESDRHDVASLRVYAAKSRIRFSEEEGFSIQVEAQAALPEHKLQQGAAQTGHMQVLLTEEAIKCLEAECNQFLQHTLADRRTDVLGLWRKIGHKAPGLWNTLSQNWKDAMPEYLPTVTVEFTLSRGEVH